MKTNHKQRDDTPLSQLELVKRLKEILIQHVTDASTVSNEEYMELRRAALSDATLKYLLPSIIGDCGDLGEVRTVIKPRLKTYRERREFLRSEFLPLMRKLENRGSIGDTSTAAALAQVDWEHVQGAWKKALERRDSDPDGVVTAARSLLETVCKHILDAKEIPYNQTADLQNLYDLTAKSLSLAPTGSTEPALRQILSGCYTVVNGMSALRNKTSDAHGKGLADSTAERRHAELAVNMAGAVSSFLILTYSTSKSK
jgi:Abortive infection C-terminus